MMPDDLDEFYELEEPVPCDGCGRWVELQRTRPCRRCHKLVCPACLEEELCPLCREVDVAAEGR